MSNMELEHRIITENVEEVLEGLYINSNSRRVVLAEQSKIQQTFFKRCRKRFLKRNIRNYLNG